MRKYTVDKIVELLSCKGIVYQVEEGSRSIKVNRDSIVNKWGDILGEEESYGMLLLELEQELSYRCFYPRKNDDYLWLETVCGE
jgi:hypothetical protein